MAEFSTVITGIGMGESARWHDDRLWFADWIAGTISVRELDSTVRVVATVPSFPISFDWLPDGRMLVVAGAQGQLLVLDGDTLRPYADLTALSPHSWNEVVIDNRGNAYVNGIGYEFPGPPQVAGVIALVRPDGTVSLVASDLAFPNGMVISADHSTLVVGESHAGCLTAFAIEPDGLLGDRTVWAAIADSAPDGICWGADSAIWYADVPNQRCVLVAEGGEVRETVAFSSACFSCAVSADTLYAMTATWPLSFEPGSPRSGAVRSSSLRPARI